MNENVRQKAKTPIKQTFYKLTNSANFNIDCQNNIDNCRFEPIYDQISEISFIKNTQISSAMQNINISLLSKQCAKKLNNYLMKNTSLSIQTIRHLKRENIL